MMTVVDVVMAAGTGHVLQLVVLVLVVIDYLSMILSLISPSMGRLLAADPLLPSI